MCGKCNVGSNTKVNVTVGGGQVTLTVPYPDLRYFDEFMKLQCSADIAALGWFKDSKEITESFAAYRAWRKHVYRNNAQEDHLFVVIGDGRTPRTGAIFSFRTSGDIISIDPQSKYSSDNVEGIRRLQSHSTTLGEFSKNILIPGKIDISKYLEVTVIGVHPHVPSNELRELFSFLLSYYTSPKINMIELPCCYPNCVTNVLGSPGTEYTDWGIHSDKRTVRVWKGISNILERES